MSVRISYEKWTYQTSEGEPDVEWGNRPDTHTEISNIRATYVETDVKVDPSSWGFGPDFGCAAKPGERVWVVIARYSTGDTFGNDTGCAEVMDVLDDAESAERLAEQFRSYNPRRGKNGEIPFRMKGEAEVPYYIPWVGYFESLEGIYVESCVVER